MTGPLLTLLNAQTLAAYTAPGYWGEETLYGIAARHARALPDRPSVRDRHRRLTYAALVDTADRLAGHLAAQGVRPGQRIAVWLPSRVETAIALLACSRNGYVCSPSLHRSHTTGHVAELVDRMRAAALIAQPGYGAGGDQNDIFDILADREFLRWTCRLGPAEGALFAGLVSGAAAPTQLVAEPMDHGVMPQSGYGMTETCSHQYTRPDDPPDRIIATSGRACDGYELRIWRPGRSRHRSRTGRDRRTRGTAATRLSRRSDWRGAAD